MPFYLLPFVLMAPTQSRGRRLSIKIGISNQRNEMIVAIEISRARYSSMIHFQPSRTRRFKLIRKIVVISFALVVQVGWMIFIFYVLFCGFSVSLVRES